MLRIAIVLARILYASADNLLVISGGLGGGASTTVLNQSLLPTATWNTVVSNNVNTTNLISQGFVFAYGRLFQLGGFRPGNINTNDCFVSDMTTFSSIFIWEPCRPLPFKLWGFGTVVIGPTIYMLGGTGTGVFETRVWTWNIVTNTSWVQSNYSLPGPRLLSSAIYAQGRIFVIGGSLDFNAHQRTTLIFDLQSQIWTQGPLMQAPRSCFGAVYARGRIFAAGGLGSIDERMEILDLSAMASGWTIGPALSTNRWGYVMLYVSGHVYLMSGNNVSNSMLVRSMDDFNIVTGNTVAGPLMNEYRYQVMGAATRDVIVSFQINSLPINPECYAGFFKLNITLNIGGGVIMSSNRTLAIISGATLRSSKLISNTSMTQVFESSWQVSPGQVNVSFQPSVLLPRDQIELFNFVNAADPDMRYQSDNVVVFLNQSQSIQLQPITTAQMSFSVTQVIYSLPFQVLVPSTRLFQDFVVYDPNLPFLWRLTSATNVTVTQFFSNSTSCNFPTVSSISCILPPMRGSGRNLSFELWYFGVLVAKSLYVITYEPTIYNSSLRRERVNETAIHGGTSCVQLSEFEGVFSFDGSNLLPEHPTTQFFHGPPENRTKYRCSDTVAIDYTHNTTTDTIRCLLDRRAILEAVPLTFTVVVMDQVITGTDEISLECKCPLGEDASTGICTQCLIGQQRPITSRLCAQCGDGTFTFKVGSPECISCLDLQGMQCKGGTGVARAGFWFDPVSVATYDCPPQLCRGGGQCAPGRDEVPIGDNILCGQCNSGYVGSNSGKCLSCSTVHGEIVFFLVVFAFLYTLFILLDAKGSRADLKIFIYFLFGIRLFAQGGTTSLSFFEIFEMNPDVNYFVCAIPFSEYQRLASRLMFPMVMLLQLLFIGTCHKVLLRWPPKTTCISTHSWLLRHLGSKFLAANYVRALFEVALYGFASFTEMILEYLNCQQVGDRHVMFLYPSVDCNSSSYSSWLIAVYLTLIFYVLGLPLTMAASAIWGSHKGYFDNLESANSKSFLSIFGCFFYCYCTTNKWARCWEIFLLLRRALLLATQILLFTRPIWRSTCFFFIMIVALVAQHKVKPFVTPADNEMEQLLLCFQLVLSGLSFAIELAKDSVRAEDLVGISILDYVIVAIAIVVVLSFCYHTRRGQAKKLMAKLANVEQGDTAEMQKNQEAEVGPESPP